MAEELSLRDLRLARKLTQEKMAELLQIRQEGVSRIKTRSDLHLSTLREVIQAMGGELRLVVEFPDRLPVVLSGFPETEESAFSHRGTAIDHSKPALKNVKPH